MRTDSKVPIPATISAFGRACAPSTSRIRLDAPSFSPPPSSLPVPSPTRRPSAITDRMGLPRYLCIHGHFYQPPRENPWLEAVEVQDSAAPFHDWNERVTRQCYAPNTRSRLLDGEGRIAGLSNNYA